MVFGPVPPCTHTTKNHAENTICLNFLLSSSKLSQKRYSHSLFTILTYVQGAL